MTPEAGESRMSERKLTLIVVPHGDLETRTLEISYRRLTLLLIVVVLAITGFVVMASSWWYLAAQATRVGGLVEQVEYLEGERQKVVELAAHLEEAEARYEQVRLLLDADPGARGREPLLPPIRPDESASPTSGVSDVPDAWPLTQAGYITRALSDEGGEAHPGIDIAVPQDAYIRAAGAGVVQSAGTDEIYGHFVLIDHGDGYASMYGHASQLFVAPGDTVERHEVIALSGSTGRSTAPHLHFELRRNGQAIDPLPYLRQP